MLRPCRHAIEQLIPVLKAVPKAPRRKPTQRHSAHRRQIRHAPGNRLAGDLINACSGRVVMASFNQMVDGSQRQAPARGKIEHRAVVPWAHHHRTPPMQMGGSSGNVVQQLRLAHGATLAAGGRSWSRPIRYPCLRMLPDDFGLNPRETLCHSADPTPPPGFVQFWSSWRSNLWSQPVGFEPWTPSRGIDPGATGLTHVLRSAGDIRIGCRITEPGPAVRQPRGIVITSHGYQVNPQEPLIDQPRWPAAGLAHIQIRFRGYPGSQMDTGDWTHDPPGYVTRGIESPGTSVLSGCVADLVNAARAARARYGDDVPISLHGESFGAGIAVVAASMLAGTDMPARLALALPTLGDWSWRLKHKAVAGIGLDVARYTTGTPDHADTALATLRLYDSVVHARRVSCPLVCKLAERDEIVPAPTAAAVYNALGSDPSRKWRFITCFGHFSGSEANADLRRHATFERLIVEFLDPALQPAAVMQKHDPA